MPEPGSHLDENGFVVLDPEPNHLTAQAIVACTLCDDDGYRGLLVCDHVDHTAAAERGMARIREVLAKDRVGGDDTADGSLGRERGAEGAATTAGDAP